MRLIGNSKALIGRTIQMTSMVFYFAVAIWIYDSGPTPTALKTIWVVLMVVGLVLILIGKHEEKKGKPAADASGSVSLRPN
jgi:hypothetical protein